MRKGLFEDSSPFTQLIMLVFCMVTCVLLFMLIGLLLASFVFGVPIAELMIVPNGGKAALHLNLMRYLQILQGVGFFVVPSFFAAYLFSGKASAYLKLNQTVPSKWFGAVLLLMLAAIPCINLIITLNELIVFPKSLSGFEQRLRNLEEAARQLTELFLKVDHAGGMFFNIFMIALLPAIGEELIFRGILQKIFTRWTGNLHVAIIVSGFLFSLMHMQFYGFFPRWLLGVMFGYLLVWSGTLWLPIFAHFVNNAVAVFVSFFIHKGLISDQLEIIGSTWKDIPLTIVALVMCVWLLQKMYKNHKFINS